jgi:DNA replication protein DnaC
MEPLGEALLRVRARVGRRVPAEGAAEEEQADPSCPICKDHGFVRREVEVGHPDFGRAIPCSCRLGEVRERLRRRSNLGSLGSRTFEAFRPEGRQPHSGAARQQLRAAFDACRSYAEDLQPSWLVLLGPPGCGKTHLAAAIANRQIELGHDVFFAVVPDLLDHLRATFAPGSDISYDELFEAVRTTRLLILDDLGTQSSSAWAQEKLFQLLNHRFNSELPTVITTNQPLDRLDSRLRARLDDRRLVFQIAVETEGMAAGELLLAELPEGLRTRTFDNFEVGTNASLRQALMLAWEFAGAPQGWLVLHGTVGCGKTHLAAAIKNELNAHGTPSGFEIVPDLLDQLRQTYAPSSDVTYDQRFEAIRNAPVLILDDYGAHSSTPWAEEKLFQLLNHRFNARLPTVVTTNLAISDAMASAPPQELRIFSRLLDPELSRVVHIDAPPFNRPQLGGRPRGPRPRRGAD